MVPHIGHQTVKNNSALSYTDYSLTLGKDFGNGLSASWPVVGTDASKALYVTPGTASSLAKHRPGAGRQVHASDRPIPKEKPA